MIILFAHFDFQYRSFFHFGKFDQEAFLLIDGCLPYQFLTRDYVDLYSYAASSLHFRTFIGEAEVGEHSKDFRGRHRYLLIKIVGRKNLYDFAR